MQNHSLRMEEKESINCVNHVMLVSEYTLDPDRKDPFLTLMATLFSFIKRYKKARELQSILKYLQDYYTVYPIS